MQNWIKFLIALWILPVVADQPSAAQLAGLLADVQNLEAGFKQTVSDDEGELLEESSGVMAFQRPGSLRWSIQEPYQYLVVTDGETLWRYDVDFEQLTTEPLASVSQTPLLILAADAEELQSRYQITESTAGGRRQFDLRPIDNKADFTKLTMVFNGALLSAMELNDKLGQETHIALNNVVTNQPELPKAYFEVNRAAENEP